ncbi:MAG: LegC family aminotransferase [Rhodospirillaceae bacterium]|nr:LegC family aminotransferase [Rhodospirillales bacterium]
MTAIDLPGKVVAALASVLPGKCGLHEPEFAGHEWDYVKDCLDTGWVSSVGAYVDRFEAMLAERVGVHAIATVNGTAALQVALTVAGVKAGDEVVVPALTFVGTANAVSHCGAFPHFADVEALTLGLDPVALDRWLADIGRRQGGELVNRLTGRPIRAVVCVHVFGHPVQLDQLAEVCARYGLVLIEDAAESLGSYYKGRHTGGCARLGVLSFNGNKIITTGGGGAILSSDPELAAAAKRLTTTAKRPHRWEFFHDEVAFNYRLPNLNAALGCAQLEQLDGFVERKRALAAQYRQAFAGMAGVSFFTERDFAKSNYWLCAIVLDNANRDLRDGVLEATNDSGFMTRPVWMPLHTLPMYQSMPRADLSCAEDMADRIVNLPSSPRLASADRGEV